MTRPPRTPPPPAAPPRSTDATAPIARTTRGRWLLVLALATAAAYSAWPTRAPSFTASDDAEVQIKELQRHVAFAHVPARVVQVELAAHPKVSQLDDIDASPAGYGRNACGPIAAAVATGGDRWPERLAEIVAAAGDDYGAHTGIQPSPYAAAMRRVFGGWNVRVADRTTLGALYGALTDGRIVIVDLKVSDGAQRPSDRPPHYAHFARVLGIDVDQGEIYLDNTLRGGPYWTVGLEDFMAAWRSPETTASLILDPPNAEPVDRWAVYIDRRWP